MLALIPAIGFTLAPFALNRFRHVVVETNDRWNPARPQLYLGATLALASLLLHALAALFIYLRVIHNLENV
jgi:hypothetical protein